MFDPNRKPWEPSCVRQILQERQDYFDPKIGEDEDGFTLQDAESIGWKVDFFHASKPFPGSGLIEVHAGGGVLDSNEGRYGVLKAIYDYELKEHQLAQGRAREVFRRLVREERLQLRALNAAQAAREGAPAWEPDSSEVDLAAINVAHRAEQEATREAIGHARQALTLSKELDAYGSDTLVGSGIRDVICGLRGNDVLRGRGGSDVLLGGPGADRLLGALGRDRLFGGSGRDRVIGGVAIDKLFGGSGPDTLLARDGRRDRVVGGFGSDRARADCGLDVRTGVERTFLPNCKSLSVADDLATARAGMQSVLSRLLHTAPTSRPGLRRRVWNGLHGHRNRPARLRREQRWGWVRDLSRPRSPVVTRPGWRG